jgi:hypothetical protein
MFGPAAAARVAAVRCGSGPCVRRPPMATERLHLEPDGRPLGLVGMPLRGSIRAGAPFHRGYAAGTYYEWKALGHERSGVHPGRPGRRLYPPLPPRAGITIAGPWKIDDHDDSIIRVLMRGQTAITRSELQVNPEN